MFIQRLCFRYLLPHESHIYSEFAAVSGRICMRCQQDCLRHMCRPTLGICAGWSLTSAAGAQLGVTWGISATRVVNNKHHVADVLAGMLLGGTVATVFALRAIPRVRCAARAPAFPPLVALAQLQVARA